ncbi:hypothetical protein NDA11_000341 [Ustilago hordei]|uniref:Uncharacterized protein n=1 Tax=Ustilago hordei TaxID=120017 RepID=I2FZL9_USTHO|nr:hypothetical protein NDA10_004856 [Ustilago hordei]KAJ1577063.1 hypothetical protein NDA15_006183 [Ustilago hordei]KAJ1578617.1 hypothetical protein NDA12_003253 [Ustilago hordei]KAJ1583929.1 hypothetical protein NDA11_000341 [Ustilago hordei]UTT91446.1 hypothetical protein NDA17_000667 [Ustilago hordei]
MARALLSTTIAIGLPLLLLTIPSGISASSTFKGMDDLLRSQAQLELPRLDDPLWMSIITRLYADCARDLAAQAQAKSGGYVSPATFVVRLILAEVSHAQSNIASAQADLALAASEARLLHLHTSAPGAHPRMSVGPSRLARLPVTIERQYIRIPFPRRVEAGDPTTSPMPHSLDQTEAHILQRRGLPVIEDFDNSMSLLVKQQEQERERAFLAAHKGIRNSSMMLSHFDDRSASRPDKANSPANSRARSRESLVSALVLQDQARFAAEITHHLAVLSLVETRVKMADSLAQTGEAHNMIVNAAV